MRLMLFFAATVCLAIGCRSAETAFHAKNTAGEGVVTTTEPLASDEPPSSFTVEALVQMGLANSPKIREAKHRFRALKNKIPQELSLPDPIVSTTTHLSPVETAAGRQAFSLGISQKVVDAERRASRASIVEKEVQAAKAEIEDAKISVAEQIRVASYQLLAIQATLQITKEDLNSLSQIEEVVLRQYEVNRSVSQQDVLQIQIESSKVENQLAELRQKEKSYFARLARLIHFDTGTQFVISDSLQHDADVGATDELITKALERHPRLSAQYSRVQRDQEKICLAQLQNRPDFTVGLNWIATSSNGISPVANGDDALLLGIGFDLPIRKERIAAASCEAKETSLASSAKMEAIQDEVAESVFDSMAKLESNGSMLTLLREDMIPKAERSLELTREEYATGNLNFVELIGAWRALLRYRVSLATLQAQRLQLLANLARQIGQVEPLHSQSLVDNNEPETLSETTGIVRPAVESPEPGSAEIKE